MTEGQIEARDYTFCSAVYPGAEFRQFLVGTPRLREAKKRAMRYAKERWGAPEKIYLYPKNYIRDSRRLYVAGSHD